MPSISFQLKLDSFCCACMDPLLGLKTWPTLLKVITQIRVDCRGRSDFVRHRCKPPLVLVVAKQGIKELVAKL